MQVIQEVDNVEAKTDEMGNSPRVCRIPKVIGTGCGSRRMDMEK